MSSLATTADAAGDVAKAKSFDVKLLVTSLAHHGSTLLEALIDEHVDLQATGLDPVTLVDLATIERPER